MPEDTKEYVKQRFVDAIFAVVDDNVRDAVANGDEEKAKDAIVSLCDKVVSVLAGQDPLFSISTAGIVLGIIAASSIKAKMSDAEEAAVTGKRVAATTLEFMSATFSVMRSIKEGQTDEHG
jgi:hypothetical protein